MFEIVHYTCRLSPTPISMTFYVIFVLKEEKEQNNLKSSSLQERNKTQRKSMSIRYKT